jgi:hypothetical protein
VERERERDGRGERGRREGERRERAAKGRRGKRGREEEKGESEEKKIMDTRKYFLEYISIHIIPSAYRLDFNNIHHIIIGRTEEMCHHECLNASIFYRI